MSKVDMETLRQELEQAQQRGDQAAAGDAHWALMAGYISLGMVQLAVGHWERISASGTLSAPLARADHARHGAIFALLMRDTPLATTRLEQSLIHARSQTSSRPEALGLLLFAAIEDDPHHARRHLQRVDALFMTDSCDALTDLRLYRACMSALLRPAALSQSGPESLNQAESLQGQRGAEELSAIAGALGRSSTSSRELWPRRDLSASHVLNEVAHDLSVLELVVALETARDMLEARSVTAPPPVKLTVGIERGSWFQVGTGPQVDLSTRGPLRDILSALLERHIGQQTQGLSVEQLFEAGWAGTTLSLTSMRARVYVAIRELRELGLEGILHSGEYGYRLDERLILRFEH